MKHVHAEVIKALADDINAPLEIEGDYCKEQWFPISIDRDELLAWVVNHPHVALRIKPQPKALSWTPAFLAGYTVSSFATREDAEGEGNRSNPVTYVLELRDDGTARLHKVEA